MAAVAGLRGSGDWATDERPKNFREFILWRNPNGSAPLTALMSKTGSESTNDPEFAWWDEPVDIVALQVDALIATATTTITVDSGDPSTTAPANVWGHADHLVAGDILQVVKDPNNGGATETVGYDNELMIVSSVTDSTSFVVTRGAAGTTAAQIPDNSRLLKVGSVFEEGTTSPSASSRNPIKYFNYTQIFKTAYDVTRTASQTRTRTGDVLKNERKRRMFDHARDLEFAFMFGVANEGTGSGGKPRRFTGGLRSFIPSNTTTIFSTSPTTTSFLNAVYKVFDFDTPAGDERVVLCGNGFLNEINKLAHSAGTIQYGPVITQYGMNMREYILPQGRLMLKTHPLMNRDAYYTYSAFLVDFSALKWRYLQDTKFEDNIQANDADRIKGQWLTEAGLEVAYGGLTCGYLGNFVI